MKIIKTYEEASNIAIVNKSEIDKHNNMSAEFHVNRQKGKHPYKKKEFGVEKIEPGKSLPAKTTIYLTEVEAKNLNELARSIIEYTNKYNELYKKYTGNES